MAQRFRAYVGNLPYNTTAEELKALFAPYGATEATVCADKETGRPRGFGFVTLPSARDLQGALSGMNGQEFGGRVLVVNEAHDKVRSADRPAQQVKAKPPAMDGRGRGGTPAREVDAWSEDGEPRRRRGR